MASHMHTSQQELPSHAHAGHDPPRRAREALEAVRLVDDHRVPGMLLKDARVRQHGFVRGLRICTLTYFLLSLAADPSQVTQAWQ